MSPALELRVDALGQRFTVSRVRGREALSRPYWFEATVLTTRRIPVERDGLVGHTVTLVIPRDDESSRKVRGVVASQRVEGNTAPGEPQRFRVRVVPRLSLLRHAARSRIFQDRSVVEVVGAVLGRMGVRSRAALVQTYPRLEYCVQYRETDLDFVERILGEHGIRYYFEHPDDPPSPEASAPDATQVDLAGVTVEGLVGAALTRRTVSEVVVLCDRANQHPLTTPARGPLLFGRDRDEGAGVRTDVVDFSWRESVRATAVTVQGYDFTTPMSRPSATVSTDEGAPPQAQSAVERLGLGVFNHRDEYLQTHVDRRAARVELERTQRGARTGRGTSLCVDLAPGYRFALDGHPNGELNREYLVTEVTHRAVAAEFLEETAPHARARRYENDFACIASDREFRPKWRPRPPRQVVETAFVTGPEGEDVHTDAMGRIKVRFPWDRNGGPPEQSSCWVRVAQSWAGPHLGAQFIPRVGTEVLVAFLDGDADRPVVIGNLYNGLHAPPFGLPEDRTRSGWRTRTTGGEGYNELSFEDRDGAEEVRLHARRDLNATIERDQRLEVREAQTVSVGQDQRVDVGGSQSTGVRQHQTVIVGGVQSTEVHDRSLTVHHNQREEIKGSSTTIVHGTMALSVSVHRAEDVAGDHLVSVAGSQRVYVSGPDGPEGERGGVFTRTDGEWKAQAARSVTLASDEALTLTCGDTRVELLPGELRFTSPKITLRADDTITLHGPGATLDLGDHAQLQGDEVSVRSRGAEVHLDREAIVRGSHVRLKGAGANVITSESVTSSTPPPPRTLTVSVHTGVHEGDTHAGTLFIKDGTGAVVATHTAAEARERDGALVFELDPDALPDPVEVTWQDGEHTLHLLGPCSPRAVADDLGARRFGATRALVARKSVAAPRRTRR
jgi:type VI secretion system secreted protein VgrG